jgi:hypothetical protein
LPVEVLYALMPATAQSTSGNVAEISMRLQAREGNPADKTTAMASVIDTAPVESLLHLMRQKSEPETMPVEETTAPAERMEDANSIPMPAEMVPPANPQTTDFIEQFAPFDPAAMDEAVHHYLGQLHGQQPVAEGGSGMRGLAVLSGAAMAGVVAVEWLRRRQHPLRVPNFLTLSYYLSGTKTMKPR